MPEDVLAIVRKRLEEKKRKNAASTSMNQVP